MINVTAAAEEVRRSQQGLANARAKLEAFEADPQVPNYYQGPPTYFTFLAQQEDKREAALKDREVAFIEFSKLGNQQNMNSLPPIGPPSKRVRSGSVDSVASTGSAKSGGLSQSSFRERIVARDKRCVISGTLNESCQAAHIVAKCNFSVNDFQGKQLWDEKFPQCCDIADHRVMDVRNGILLSTPIHQAFDKFEITIRKKEDGRLFVVEVDTFKVSALVAQYENKTFEFDPLKKHLWPREEFLAFHNKCFDDARSQIVTAADEYDSDNYDSNETVAVLAESSTKTHDWSTIDELEVPVVE